jgi:hypothetical protein
MIHDTHARISAYLEKELHAEAWMVKIYTHKKLATNLIYIFWKLKIHKAKISSGLQLGRVLLSHW